jgi:predicted protein tyrosine phosphatase
MRILEARSMMKSHLLFVCTANQQRSPTAESLFRNHPRFEARSCGCSPLATAPCTADWIAWADLIFCMEDEHRRDLLARFPMARRKPIAVLDIPDRYERDDPNLVLLLQEALKKWVE